MTNTATAITNEELFTKLKESYLEQAHKDELKTLIPYMSDEARDQLLSLIEQSHQVKMQEDKAKAEMQPGLKQLNAEYNQKMNQLVKTLNEKIRKDYEGLKQGEEEKELAGMEAKFNKK